jgi:hypothetical protein
MDYQLIPDSLCDTEKTEYLLRDMPVNEVIQIAREALRKVDYGIRNTYKIELWVRNENDKQGNIDYLKHIINRGRLRYSDILKAFKLYNPFFELDPSRPIDWHDTMMSEKKKNEVFLTDDFEYVPKSKKPIKIFNPRWEHTNPNKKQTQPDNVSIDDTIQLKVDIVNYKEKGTVMFKIQKEAQNGFGQVEMLNGTHLQGIGKVEWHIDNKIDPTDKIYFIASINDAVSEKCMIPVFRFSFSFSN